MIQESNMNKNAQGGRRSLLAKSKMQMAHTDDSESSTIETQDAESQQQHRPLLRAGLKRTVQSARNLFATSYHGHLQEEFKKLTNIVHNLIQEKCNGLDRWIQIHSDKAMARLQNDNTLGATLSMKKLRELQQQHARVKLALEHVEDYMNHGYRDQHQDKNFCATLLSQQQRRHELLFQDAEAMVEQILGHYDKLVALEPQPTKPSDQDMALKDDGRVLKMSRSSSVGDVTQPERYHKGISARADRARQRRRHSLEHEIQYLSTRAMAA